MEKKDGLEGLTKPREKKESSSSSKSSERKSGKRGGVSHPKGHELRRIVTTKLHDGTFHHEHHYTDARGVPSSVQEASSAGPDDAGSHVAEQFGGGQAGDPMQQEMQSDQSPALSSGEAAQ